MKINKLNSAIALGFVAIVGILVVQLLWTKEAFNAEGKKFDQKVHVTLLRVVDRLYQYNNNEFPLKNPIQRIVNDYYVVNVNNDFDANLLEFCLKAEFERSNLLTDFEYAIYKCESDEMVYGNYVSFTDKKEKKSSLHFPKQKNLVYYFAIRFPNEKGYLLSSLKFWLVLSSLLILILLIYVYSIFTILQQKKYSELQKDFINNMTHEFKTPLSSILIASHYLNKQEVIRSDERLAKYTGIIIDQSVKLNNHIGKILDIAKTDSDSTEMKKEQVGLQTVLRNVTESIQLKYPEAKIELDIPAEEIFFSADNFHFTNLVYNLLDNAVKYCDKQAQVIITLANEERRIRLRVSDNGPGINKNDLNFVFDKFYRSPNKRSNEVTGFGLGLYYVKKICLLHGWNIGLKNNEGSGLQVSLDIPKRL